ARSAAEEVVLADRFLRCAACAAQFACAARTGDVAFFPGFSVEWVEQASPVNPRPRTWLTAPSRLDGLDRAGHRPPTPGTPLRGWRHDPARLSRVCCGAGIRRDRRGPDHRLPALPGPGPGALPQRPGRRWPTPDTQGRRRPAGPLRPARPVRAPCRLPGGP